jgi:uncharacterized protein YjiS (DUF1127 family)
MAYDTRLASTDSESLAAFAEVTACNTCRDTPTIIVRYGSAGNDAVISENAAEPWPPHAIAANELGDIAATESTSSTLSGSYELHRAARAHRSRMLGSIIVAAIDAVAAIARRAYARHRQRQRASATYDVLRKLDDHTLRDMGFDRSEIWSVAAEVTGKAQQTRVRANTFDETPDRRYWTRYDHFMVEREARARRSAWSYAFAPDGRWQKGA